MKKLLILALFLTLSIPCFAQLTSISNDRKIVSVEVKPDVAIWALDTIRILYFTKTCEITYRKLDSTNTSVGEEQTFVFMDVVDNPDTEEDETSTDFTDLMANIKGIELAVKNAVTPRK